MHFAFKLKADEPLTELDKSRHSGKIANGEVRLIFSFRWRTILFIHKILSIDSHCYALGFVTKFLQFIDYYLYSSANILYLSYFHCLLKIHWTENSYKWLLEFSFELLWLWEPIDPNMLPNNYVSSLYSWVNSLYGLLNVCVFMFYCISTGLRVLCWIKCTCGSNRSRVTTGDNLKAL